MRVRASIEADWFAQHRTGSFGSALDLWVITLKFSPLCYLHIFCSGMLLARWRFCVRNREGGPGQFSDPRSRWRCPELTQRIIWGFSGWLVWPLKIGATLGYLGVSFACPCHSKQLLAASLLQVCADRCLHVTPSQGRTLVAGTRPCVGQVWV